ncbi:TPA: GNAT family N-acetyltransferase [Elizabethkingia anophelis]
MDTVMDYKIESGYENMDINAVHDFLSNKSYWASGISLEAVKKSLKNSYCSGVFYGNVQVGFGRLITDYTTFAYLADVYILENHRGKGLAKRLMEHMMDLEWIDNLRRILLATLDAHDLYRQFGFNPPVKPESFMEIDRPGIYKE